MKIPPEPAPAGVPRLHDVAEVAFRLNLSEKTVRRAIGRGEMRAHRVGRLLRVSEDDLMDYLSKRRTVP
jgi:excisionase family DNA binding protein